MSTIRPLVLSMILAAIAAPAWAGPKEDMKAMSAKFLALRTYHVSMQNSDKRVPKSEIDFAAPDRYRMEMGAGMGTQYVVGDTMYMTVQGRSMRVPMPKGTMTQWRQMDYAFREIDRMQVEALGAEAVGGKPTKKYRMTQGGQTPTSTVLWVGADGYPVKLETTGSAGGRSYTTTMFYSRFNDPTIRVVPPK